MKDKELERQKFVEEYLDIELDIKDDPLTTWENNYTDRMVSPLILNRYFKFLRGANIGLLVLLITLMLIVFGMTIKFLFFQQYEMILFLDGTDLSCIYNPSTGVMVQNDK